MHDHKQCSELVLGLPGTVFLNHDDEQFGEEKSKNMVVVKQVVAYDANGVFVQVNEFTAGVFYPWTSVKKLHLPKPMPMDLM